MLQSDTQQDMGKYKCENWWSGCTKDQRRKERSKWTGERRTPKRRRGTRRIRTTIRSRIGIKWPTWLYDVL